MRELPTGTVTFLFTDVEGSTKLLHELGAEVYADALAEHRHVIREACGAEGGVEVDTQGDAFFFAFPTAPGALAAAAAFTGELSTGPIQVRVGLHTGTPLLTDEGYVGDDVHRAARIAASGHGGQVLVSKATAPLVELELRDLGEHRFKDLSAPERVYQLGDEQFPALKSLYRTNLPVPTTPFLGRDRELAEVAGLLEGTRLLTLTGPGGTGKTRLATQAAGLASDSYPDGVWWIPLASLRDPKLVLETAAQAIGAADGFAEHIADKSMLLIFDNFEHVVEAAPGLPTLLATCPNLRVLVTSRELLRVYGEVEYPVPPLAPTEAVELFCTRSRLAADEAIGELCARLDNLPLAVELAAARTKALSPAQVLDRLSDRLDLLKGGRDAEARQRTLRATIEWSYALLLPEEQQLFARLSVFSGGCTLEAAEAVCDADPDSMQSLVEKSMLLQAYERFRMLETLREFAAERLEESGDADGLRRLHAVFFIDRAQSLGMTYESIEIHGGQRHDIVVLEQGNLRAAIDWAAEQDLEIAARLAVSLEGFWVAVSPYEAVRRFGTLLEREADMPVGLRAGCWRCLASSTQFSGRIEDSIEQNEKSLALYRRAGDERGVAIILNRLGTDVWELGDLQRGRSLIEESLARYRALGFRVGEAAALGGLGRVEYREGNVERGLELVERSAKLCREVGFTFFEAKMLDVLASCAVELGRLDDAVRHSCSVLVLARRTGERQRTVFALARIASIAVARRNLTRAGRLWGGIEAEEARGSLGIWERKREDLAAPVLAASGAEFERGRVAGHRLTLDEVVDYALEALD